MIDPDPAVAIWQEALPNGVDTLWGDRVTCGHVTTEREDTTS